MRTLSLSPDAAPEFLYIIKKMPLGDALKKEACLSTIFNPKTKFTYLKNSMPFGDALKKETCPNFHQARTSHHMPHRNLSRPDAITLSQR